MFEILRRKYLTMSTFRRQRKKFDVVGKASLIHSVEVVRICGGPQRRQRRRQRRDYCRKMATTFQMLGKGSSVNDVTNLMTSTPPCYVI